MRLSVPFNWDPKLLDMLDGYPVHDLYGALHKDILGGGRPAYSLPKVEKKNTKEIIESIHSRGIKFNYIINTPCLGNIEFDDRFHVKILQFMDWINDVGADYVTVTIPYLIKIIRKQYPAIKVKVSTFAYCRSVQKVRFFEAMGAHGISLDADINRDFELLENIRKKSCMGMNLIVNNPCLYQCPYSLYHDTGLGHSTQVQDCRDNPYINYCVYRCTKERFSNTAEFLKSRWIRPEDLKEYENIGIDYFKISGRTKTSEWIHRCVKAYSRRRYEGNFFDITNLMESETDRYFGSGVKSVRKRIANLGGSMEGGHLKSGMKALSMLPVGSAKNLGEEMSKMNPVILRNTFNVYSNATKPFIDNRKLDGFIDFFRKNSCEEKDCTECGYCERWSKNLRIDEDEKKRYILSLEGMLDTLEKSEFVNRQNV